MFEGEMRGRLARLEVATGSEARTDENARMR